MNVRFGKDFYNEEYFTKGTRSNYGKLNPKGGYSRKLYFPYKAQQIADILFFSGYTTRWKPKNCLVTGCAVGYLVYAMQIDGDIDSYGIDISEYAIKRGTKEKIKNLVVGDVCKLPYNDNEFEMVTALELLEHIPEDGNQLNDAIDQLIRVCNGYIVISTPNADDDEHPDQHKSGDPSHFSVHTSNWWCEQFEKRGCKTFFQHDGADTKTAILVFEVNNGKKD